MEPLLKQLRELPAKFAALPRALRLVLIGGLLAVVAAAVGVSYFASNGEGYQYAFTNLTSEDAAEAAQTLKNANIPFRAEAGGAALAVPANKVYDVRLLLASAGIPKGGGVGFELFDRGDLGVSEFTQKINLRRATEGELARTIGKLSEVRSARVHITLPEKGLYRDEDRKASAAVVLNLQPGRTLSERSLAGVRHLVSSAVSGLNADQVTIVDGHGAVLTADSAWDDPASSYQRKLEKDLEQRIVSLLEPVVGQGSVIAKVTANLDSAQVNSTAEVFDGDNPVLRSERKMSQNASQDSQSGGGVAGAAANQPLVPQQATTRTGSKGNSASSDEIKNYEISKTTTTSVARLPRLTRLSVALLLDGKDGKPRTPEELAQLGELAKRSVGFDDERGDQFDISSAAFGHAGDEAAAAAKAAEAKLPMWMYAAAGGGAFLVLLMLFGLLRRKKAPAQSTLTLQPGKKVSELEAEANAAATAALPAPPPAPEVKALKDPGQIVQEKARALASGDPNKAVTLIRAWIAADIEAEAAREAEENHAAA